MSDEQTGLATVMASSAPSPPTRQPHAPRRDRSTWWRAGIVAVVLAFALFVVPLLPTFYVGSAGQMAAYAIVAMGASLVIQHANLPSIGHGAFFGIGGYSVGLFMLHDIVGTVPALLLTLCVTGGFAAVMGVVVLRTRAAYFMMITIAISQLLSGVASSLGDFTGGDNGLTGLPPPTIGGIDLADPKQFYLLCLAVLIVVSALVVFIVASPYGHSLRALKHDDRRARSLGVRPLRVRLVAFVASGVITGLGGALFTLNLGYADPTSLAANASGEIFLMVVLAGRLGTLGPVVGAVVIEFITLIVGSHTTHSPLVLGIVSALVALFLMRTDGAPRRPGRVAEPPSAPSGDPAHA